MYESACVYVSTIMVFIHSLLELGCLTCARRVSDGVAFATHMKLTVGTLLSMPNYLAELAEIRAVPGAMIVTTMSADHRQRISAVRAESFTNRFSLQIVLWGLANQQAVQQQAVQQQAVQPPGSVDVMPTAILGLRLFDTTNFRRFSPL
jgi:hypothetical protein